MPTTNDQRVKDLGEEFVQAQQRGDPAALDSLLADEFKLVGPLGFVLDKQQWLAQYRAGALINHSVQWDQVDVRVLGQVAIAIGRQTQRASYQGQPANGTFRVTQIAIEHDGRWLLAGLHFSPIAQPPAMSQETEMPIIKASTLKTGNLKGVEHGATISLILDHSEPGHGPRLHRHPYDETWVVQEGKLTFQLAGERHQAGPGDIIIAPPGVPHKFTNNGPGPSSLVCIHANATMVTEWLE